MAAVEQKLELSVQEQVDLAAVDSIFYCQNFFPKTFRQPSAIFHRKLWEELESPFNRYLNEIIFRDGAKTTIARAFISKRIAYGMSNTILLIGKGEKSALRSVQWLQKQVLYNSKWAQTYNLRKGDKWNPADGEIEIINDTLDYPIRLLGMGITGQVRGVNIDDYRPDLIVVDDPCDEENTASDEQRKKMSDLFFGALYNTLTPASENPDAKLILLQTLLNQLDLSSQCKLDPTFRTIEHGCFISDGTQIQSAWPARWPLEDLLKKKQAFINRNQLSLWLKEYECTIIAPETSSFDLNWLQYWDILPDGMTFFMAIDPVPPPTDQQIAKGLHKKNYECLAVIGVTKGKYYLVEYKVKRGHDPDWTVATFFELLDRWKPLRVRIETRAYQQTLKWLLEKEMHKRRRYVQINSGVRPGTDKMDMRKKQYRLVDAFSGIASNKVLYVHRTHVEFIEQFGQHPYATYDDVLEATAEAINEARNSPFIDGEYEEVFDESDIKPLPDSWRISA